MDRPNSIRILHIDTNHHLLWDQLEAAGFINELDHTSSKEAIAAKIHNYHGIVIRSRFKIDAAFLDNAINLQFIARVGAGLESIDETYAAQKGIRLIAAPEGNSNAVGEHALGMLLSLCHKLNNANTSVKTGHWLREHHRGYEIEGKTIGIIGYGNMGRSFAKKLQGFDAQVICYDIKPNVGDNYATQVTLDVLQKKADILSLHTPLTPLTDKMINHDFIERFSKPFWFINTARGKSVVTKDLVKALKSGKILGAALDVLEYEKTSFESLFDTDTTKNTMPEDLAYLLKSDQVMLSPHIAGWTYESHQKLAQVIVNKVFEHYNIK